MPRKEARRLRAGDYSQNFLLKLIVVGGDEAVCVVSPRAAGQVGDAAPGLCDEEGGWGVVPGGVAGADGDVYVPGGEPGAPDTGAPDRAYLPALLEDSSQLGDFLEDATTVTPTEAVSEALLKAHLREALDELPERERQIIELRFGMKDDRPRTLEEVGREFDITRERVRQIQMKTLNLLREQRRTQNLREYLR